MPKLRFNFNLINTVHSVPNCCSSRWIEWKMMIIIAYLFISKKLRVANFAHFQLCVCEEHFTWFHLVLPTYGGIQQNFPQGISSRLPARIVRVCVRVCMGLCVCVRVCVVGVGIAIHRRNCNCRRTCENVCAAEETGNVSRCRFLHPFPRTRRRGTNWEQESSEQAIRNYSYTVKWSCFSPSLQLYAPLWESLFQLSSVSSLRLLLLLRSGDDKSRSRNFRQYCQNSHKLL